MSYSNVYVGDGLEHLRMLPSSSIDAIITDPPYGVGIEYSELFEDTPEYVRGLLPVLIKEGERVARVVLFPSGKYENEKWIYQNHPPKWRMCWYKGAQSTASPIGFSDWEMIFVYGRDVMRHVHDYMPVRTRPADNGHPCPKDVRWATWLIDKFTEPGDTVFDPFMGSGTTGVACAMMDRNFLGVELEPEYFKIAKKRIERARAQLTLGI